MAQITVQEMATLLRNIAYSDNQTHGLDWSLSVVHPKTNDGDVGFSGGIWRNHNHRNSKKDIRLSFSFSETRGIHQFMFWRDKSEIRFDFIGKGGKIGFEKFKELVIKEYGIKELYQTK